MASLLCKKKIIVHGLDVSEGVWGHKNRLRAQSLTNIDFMKLDVGHIFQCSVVTHTGCSIAIAMPNNVLVLTLQHHTFSSIVCVLLPFPVYVL